MNNVYEQKYNFCRHELLALVQDIDKDILRLEYTLHSSGEETVTIIWLSSTGSVHKPISVTGDSLSALTRDVLKYL